MTPATPQLTGFHLPMKLPDVREWWGRIEEDLGRNRTLRTKLTIPECIRSSLQPRLQSSSTGTWECQIPTLCCLHTPMVEGNVPLCLQKTTWYPLCVVCTHQWLKAMYHSAYKRLHACTFTSSVYRLLALFMCCLNIYFFSRSSFV